MKIIEVKKIIVYDFTGRGVDEEFVRVLCKNHPLVFENNDLPLIKSLKKIKGGFRVHLVKDTNELVFIGKKPKKEKV